MVVIYVVLSCLTLVASQHPGAYSSPQYAKKMYPNTNFNMLDHREGHGVPPRRRMDPADEYDANGSSVKYPRSSFLENAGDFLSDSGGQLLSSLAKDIIGRSTGSSQVGLGCITQVLSLNLTNLVILVILKALILGAGFFGAGAWKGYNYGRSLDDNSTEPYITEDEILMYLSYLAGLQNKDFSCLYRISCHKPQLAAVYSSGADILLQGTKLLQGNSTELHDYEEISKGIREAASWGEEGMPCSKRYQCGE